MNWYKKDYAEDAKLCRSTTLIRNLTRLLRTIKLEESVETIKTYFKNPIPS